MFESIGRSWKLMLTSLKVLKHDKELMVFPLISGIFGLLALIVFLIPLIFVQALQEGIITYVVVFLFYLVSYFIVIFFNAAIVGATKIRLEGGDPTLQDGLDAATKHLGAVFGWAVVAATVGLILNILAGKARDNVLGRIVIGLVGGAWNLITFFVVPVIVYEGLGPIEAIKKSTNIVKNQFGETVIGGMGIGAAVGIITFAGVIILGGLTYFAWTAAGFTGLAIGLGILVLFILVMGLMSSALNGIFRAALYHYAETGTEPPGWDFGGAIPVGKKMEKQGGEQG